MRPRFVGAALLLGVVLVAVAGGRDESRPYRFWAATVGAQFIAPVQFIAPAFYAPVATDAPSAAPDQLAALQEILALPEFQVEARRGLLDWLLDPIRSWWRLARQELWDRLIWLFEAASEAGGGAIAVYVGIGVACVVLIGVAIVLGRLMRGTMAGDDALADVAMAGPPRAADELARARVLAQAGDPRRAVHHLYRAVLLRLDERDHLPFDGTLTNRELLPRVSSEPALAGPFAELVARFDRLWYGQADCSAEEYAAFAQLGERVWQAAGTVEPAQPGRRGVASAGVPLGASSGAR